MAILQSLDQVALIIALVLGIFRFEFNSFSKKTKDWYRAGSKLVKVSPPSWLFSVVWPILYILEITAMFRYIVNRSPFPGTHLDSVVFLFLVQAILCIMWYPLFFQRKRVIFSAIVILFIMGSQLACLAIMGADEEWTSFALMLILFLWCMFAGILNFYWIYVVRVYRDELSQYYSDSEEEIYDEDEPTLYNKSGGSGSKKRVRTK